MPHDEILPPARHEPSEVGMRLVYGVVLALVASIILLSLLVYWLFPKETLDRTLEFPQPSFPQPRLQTKPMEELTELRREKLDRLNGAGWIDQAKGIAHVPIAYAMRKTAEENIAGWPGAQATLALTAPKTTSLPTQVKEKPHEVAHSVGAPVHAARVHATPGRCWIDSRRRRHCIRTKNWRGATNGRALVR